MAFNAIVTGIVFGLYFLVAFAKNVSKGVDSPFEFLVLLFKAVAMIWFIAVAAVALTHC